MIVEYVLLLAISAMFILNLFTSRGGSFSNTFNNSAPRLGARVEKLIRTGDGFVPTGTEADWALKK